VRFADLLASVEIVGNFLMDEKEVEQRYIQGFIHYFLQGAPLQTPPTPQPHSGATTPSCTPPPSDQTCDTPPAPHRCRRHG